MNTAMVLPPIKREYLDVHRQRILSRSEERCPTCHAFTRSHTQCKRCDILIGPGHYEQTGRDGLCSACYRRKHEKKA